MVDAVHVMEERPKEGDIVNISSRKLDGWIQVFALADAQVIEHDYFVSLGEEVVGQSRSQESCSSSYEKSH
jgi:hypothetical protein